jgi:hypothetical protein
MKELTGNNGAKIKIGVAPFKDSMALKNAIFAEFTKGGLDINGILGGKGVGDFLSMDAQDLDINKIVLPILQIDSSDAVSNALFRCMARCTYNSGVINEDTFETEAARGDYYLVAFEVLKANLAPFFSGVAFKLKQTLKQIATEKQNQESK